MNSAISFSETHTFAIEIRGRSEDRNKKQEENEKKTNVSR